MPVIYGMLASPPCRSAILTAKLVGLDFTIKPVDIPSQEHKSKEYLKKNPAHSVPTYEEDDGFVIFDSHAIVTYLVSKYGKNDSLYPKDLRARALVDNMLHFSNATLFSSIIQHIAPAFAGKPFSEETEAVLLDRLTTLNTILSERAYVAGDHLTVADICIVNNLTEASALGFQFTAFPNITRWQEKLKGELEFYDEVVTRGTDELKGYFTDYSLAKKYQEFVANKKQK